MWKSSSHTANSISHRDHDFIRQRGSTAIRGIGNGEGGEEELKWRRDGDGEGGEGEAKTISRTKHPINHEELLKYQNK